MLINQNARALTGPGTKKPIAKYMIEKKKREYN